MFPLRHIGNYERSMTELSRFQIMRYLTFLENPDGFFKKPSTPEELIEDLNIASLAYDPLLYAISFKSLLLRQLDSTSDHDIILNALIQHAQRASMDSLEAQVEIPESAFFKLAKLLFDSSSDTDLVINLNRYFPDRIKLNATQALRLANQEFPYMGTIEIHLSDHPVPNPIQLIARLSPKGEIDLFRVDLSELTSADVAQRQLPEELSITNLDLRCTQINGPVVLQLIAKLCTQGEIDLSRVDLRELTSAEVAQLPEGLSITNLDLISTRINGSVALQLIAKLRPQGGVSRD